MTDKIKKSLAKLTAKERHQVKKIIELLLSCKTKGLDIVMLKGTTDTFRVLKGSIRIIFTKSPAGKIKLLAIERRSEKTYRNF